MLQDIEAKTIPLTGNFGEKQPRYYQVDGAEEVARYLEEGFTRIEVIGPTGCGKTLTSKLIAMSERVRSAINCQHKDKIRVLFISPRHRLNRQAVESYGESSTVELIPQSAFSSIPEDVLEAGWDICFIDECHHEAMMSIQMLLAKLIEKPIVGFTADNQRNDGMLCKFERCVVLISEQEAAERGFIEKVGINTVLDYSNNNKAQLALDIVRQFGQSMGNTIAFFRTSKEVREFHAGLIEMGYTSGYLDEKSSELDLDARLGELSTGDIQFLANCSKIGEGIDTPNCTDVLLMRQFKSRAEKKQYIGRAIRPDSPCAAWELMNPLKDGVAAKQCVGGVKYERLIYKEQGEWFEELTSGQDDSWGRMSQLRVKPESANDAIIEGSDADYGKAGKGGKALNLKSEGIDSNIRTENSFEEAGKVSLQAWIKQHQLDFFSNDTKPKQEVRVRGKRNRKTRQTAQAIAA